MLIDNDRRAPQHYCPGSSGEHPRWANVDYVLDPAIADLAGFEDSSSFRIISPLVSHATPKVTTARDSSQNTGLSHSRAVLTGGRSTTTMSRIQARMIDPQMR